MTNAWRNWVNISNLDYCVVIGRGWVYAGIPGFRAGVCAAWAVSTRRVGRYWFSARPHVYFTGWTPLARSCTFALHLFIWIRNVRWETGMVCNLVLCFQLICFTPSGDWGSPPGRTGSGRTGRTRPNGLSGFCSHSSIPLHFRLVFTAPSRRIRESFAL